jgi:ribosome-associated protein
MGAPIDSIMPEDPIGQRSDGVEIAPGVRVPAAALEFSYSSASGPGGQNVNKRATRAQLRVRLKDIPIPPRALERLATLASHWVVGGDTILIDCDEHRSQSRNREGCLERLRALVIAAKVPPKPRIRTRPSRGAVERRIEAKKRRAATKRTRRDIE